MATTYLKLKDYHRKSDGVHVIRCQLPLRKCAKLKKSCGYRNNGICLHDKTCFLDIIDHNRKKNS